MAKKKKKKPVMKFTYQMRTKLIVLFFVLLLGLSGLIGRLMYIEYTSGEKYQKKVLSMQAYDSQTIPYQRGDILDCRGNIMATSMAVYNVILDCYVMTDKEEYIEPTIQALTSCFPELNREELLTYAKEKKDSRYIILARKLPYEQIQPFVELTEEKDEDGKLVHPDIQGVWFEKEYQRNYPYGTLAGSVIGFTSAGDVGTTGLENYYNDILNGVNGRQYGYLNSDSNFEKTVIPAEDGYNLICTLDVNIQMIVEKKLQEFNEAYRDNYRVGDGSLATAVIIMNPNNGEILAMAQTPTFDLNNPRNLSALYSEEETAAMTDEEISVILNGLWQNYGVTHTYEPGSVQKPFTVSCGLETGTITTDMTFECDGYEMFGGKPVKCVNKNGHGTETVEGALMDSCNDSLMQMSYKIGAENFLDYQYIFGFGQKTGIDLPGEANTASLMYTLENMKPVDLATNSFGQNFNCTMIEMISAFASLINGGHYYQPHLVKKITDASGNIVSTIDAAEVKQTISAKTSETIKTFLYHTVQDGTAKTAKVDGYSMGGKTGTAEKLPRGNGKYLVSFMGFVPYENPQLIAYCIVEEPNVEQQDHSTYAQNITREILEEVLPYLNIYPDEEKTGVNADLTVTGTDQLTNHTPYAPTEPVQEPETP